MSERDRGPFVLRPGRPKITRKVGGYAAGGVWISGRETVQELGPEPGEGYEVDALLRGITRADLHSSQLTGFARHYAGAGAGPDVSEKREYSGDSYDVGGGYGGEDLLQDPEQLINDEGSADMFGMPHGDEYGREEPREEFADVVDQRHSQQGDGYNEDDAFDMSASPLFGEPGNSRPGERTYASAEPAADGSLLGMFRRRR